MYKRLHPGLLKPAKTGVCKVSHKFTFINLHPFHSYSQGYLEQMVVFSVVSFLIWAQDKANDMAIVRSVHPSMHLAYKPLIDWGLSQTQLYSFIKFSPTAEVSLNVL